MWIKRNWREIHLLLHCSAMNIERNYVTATINKQLTNEMFLRNLTSRDITVVKSLAQFIYTEYNKSQVTCRYIIHIIMPSWSDFGITTGRLLLSNLLFGFLGPVRDVSVAFVIRRGGALWRISELQSQLIFSMRSGMFFRLCKNIPEYVVQTRSWLK